MFTRFLRHLAMRGTSLLSLSAADLDSFLVDVDNRCAPGKMTRKRYAKLVDRLCGHLVELGLTEANPATDSFRSEVWPEDEPRPLFLDPKADEQMPEWTRPLDTDTARETRNRAIVALLLGTGVTGRLPSYAALGGLCQSHPFCVLLWTNESGKSRFTPAGLLPQPSHSI
jgi:hypothetical protein